MSSASSQKTIADYAVALVTALGSDTVFSLAGDTSVHLNRAVGLQPGLRAVYCQHEQAAVAAAEGYACAADCRKAGFAVVASRPGIANAATSLLSAHINSIPLIVLAGEMSSGDIDPFAVRQASARAFVTPCVKRFARVTREHFREEIVLALVEAFTGRPGPVVIELPLDVQVAWAGMEAGIVAADVVRVRHLAASMLDVDKSAANFTDIFARLMSARRPLVYVGNGVRIAGAEAWIRAFLEQTRTPAVFSWPAFDILPADHPLNMGCPGGLAPIFANRVLGEADHIVFLGARLDLATTGFQRDDFGGQAERLIVDIDAAELKKFAALPRTAVAHLDLRALPGATIPSGVADPAWIAWCQAQRASGLAEEDRRLSNDAMTIRVLSQRLSKWAANRVVVPCSSGYATETFIRFFTPAENSRSFLSAGLGAMGFGLPMALGAAFGSDRPVACVDADGGLMLNIQELATLRSQAPRGFLLFVMNNDGYESIRVSQERHFGAVYGSDEDTGVSIPSYEALSAAFDLPYLRIDTPAELDDFLASYDPSAPPMVIDVMIARTEPRGPSVKTIVKSDGRLASTPLKDIDW